MINDKPITINHLFFITLVKFFFIFVSSLSIIIYQLSIRAKPASELLSEDEVELAATL
jgi:hypothetical protein